MGVKTWGLIKRSKQFYVKTYRGAETATVFLYYLIWPWVLAYFMCILHGLNQIITRHTERRRLCY